MGARSIVPEGGIYDTDALQRWLDGKNRDEALVMSSRVSLRCLPLITTLIGKTHIVPAYNDVVLYGFRIAEVLQFMNTWPKSQAEIYPIYGRLSRLLGQIITFTNSEFITTKSDDFLLPAVHSIVNSGVFLLELQHSRINKKVTPLRGKDLK